jgi:hypothetical protein
MAGNIVSDNWERPLDSLAGNGRLEGAQLGEYESAFFLETDVDDDTPFVLGYTEYLEFARGNGHIPPSLLRPDGEGWLTDEGESRVAEYLRSLLAEPRYAVPGEVIETLAVDGEQGGDDPNFTVTIAVLPGTDMTVGQFFETIEAPFAAALINVSDPGTFNHPYLYSQLG